MPSTVNATPLGMMFTFIQKIRALIYALEVAILPLTSLDIRAFQSRKLVLL